MDIVMGRRGRKGCLEKTLVDQSNMCFNKSLSVWHFQCMGFCVLFLYPRKEGEENIHVNHSMSLFSHHLSQLGSSRASKMFPPYRMLPSAILVRMYTYCVLCFIVRVTLCVCKKYNDIPVVVYSIAVMPDEDQAGSKHCMSWIHLQSRAAVCRLLLFLLSV